MKTLHPSSKMQPPLKCFQFLRLTFCSGVIATTAMLSLLGSGLCPAAWAAWEESPKTVIDEAWQIVNSEFVDPNFNQVDWQATRQQLLNRDYTSREQAYKALRQAIKELGDPYTRFMNPQQFQALRNQTSGELSGVGIRLKQGDETQVLTVVEPIEDSPALRAGIQAGDRILSIDGQPTQGMSVERAATLIKGKVGTQVTLKLTRDNETEFDISLTREQIELPTVRHFLKQEGNLRVGYIRLYQFSAPAASQMRRAIRHLNDQQAEAFVLDLRGNPGGLLQASIEIARMWLEEGIIVRTIDRKGQWQATVANQTALTAKPVVVLVDRDSASSSEILTGALQDNDRAVVIGDATFGKAFVQSVHSLMDGSGVAVTVSHYYTPNGTDISHQGIIPNVQLNLSNSQRQQLASDPDLLGTAADPHYTEALSVLTSLAVGQAPSSRSRQLSQQMSLP